MAAKDLDNSIADLLIQELEFTFTRSSGPGGQHVNKVNTQVELKFNINESSVLTPEQKERITQKLKSRITNDGVLILSSKEERSQIRNRQLVVEKFLKLISQALAPIKKRIPTKPPPASSLNRLEEKRKIAEKKQYRKKPEDI